MVKADGLAAGKGVTVCDTLAEAERAIASARRARPRARAAALGRHRGAADGREASVIALCDGRDALALPAARDHKRLLDGDRGPNTGGMGAYSPVPGPAGRGRGRTCVAPFHRPILAELARAARRSVARCSRA